MKMGVEFAHWLGKCLLEAAEDNSERKFFCICRFNHYQLWMDRFQNNRGTFFKISLNEGSKGLVNIIIPKGVKCDGWRNMGMMIISIFHSNKNSFGVKTKNDEKKERDRKEQSKSGKDESLFLSKCDGSSAKFGKKGRCFLEGSLTVTLQRWKPDINKSKELFAFGGGWIAIEGLPFHIWTKKMFCKIAEFCGGLIEIDRRTENLQSLFEARIKVGENENSFIPAEVEIEDGDRFFNLKLRPLSRFFSGSGSIKNPLLRQEVEDDSARLKVTSGSRGRKDEPTFQNEVSFKKQSNVIWRRKSDSCRSNEEVVTVENDEVVAVENAESQGAVMITANHKCCVQKIGGTGLKLGLFMIRPSMFWIKMSV
ncbi:hypothetical protein EZV62_023821 [Acer yangbiense]|uniref:Uncharacterized protein n=1 Tax=Acer yangbiense TaxID=1000413 RepID=A0A5C7H339_9ROSI|nr:hypothetical protein EZV62_023821 [Acer yangbiense]